MRTAALIVLLAFAAGSPNEAFPADRPVARVNDAEITEAQLEEAVDRLIPRASFHGSLKADRLAEYREEALENLVVAELKYQYALSKQMKPDRGAVKARLKQVRDAFASRREYKDWLKRTGRTESQLRDLLERESLLNQAQASVVGTASRMSAEQVREHYEKNVDRFREPDAVRIRIFSTKDRLKAEAAHADISKGADFGDVAARRSEDDYRIRGGDIGYVHRGRIYPELEDAAFKLKPGEITGPILAEGMWFIIKAEDRRTERQIPFDEVKEKLKSDLEKKRAAELEKEWIAALRSQARIEVLISTRATSTVDKN